MTSNILGVEEFVYEAVLDSEFHSENFWIQDKENNFLKKFDALSGFEKMRHKNLVNVWKLIFMRYFQGNWKVISKIVDLGQSSSVLLSKAFTYRSIE